MLLRHLLAEVDVAAFAVNTTQRGYQSIGDTRAIYV